MDTRKLMIASAMLLSACAGQKIVRQVGGFPQDLEIRVHERTFSQVQRECYRGLPTIYKALGGYAEGCAYVNLDAKICDIFIRKGAGADVLKHEIAHCRGGDHNGVQQKNFDDWRKRHPHGT